MSNEKSQEHTISLGRFPELHADIEAGLLKDDNAAHHPRLERHDEPLPGPPPRHASFRKFARRMFVRVLSILVAIL
ncbi:hypothetical protein EV175_005887, partial [Coemansia sp. RSA 1933]